MGSFGNPFSGWSHSGAHSQSHSRLGVILGRPIGPPEPVPVLPDHIQPERVGPQTSPPAFPVKTWADVRPPENPRPFGVVILSARPENLRACLSALLANEPTLPRERIVVVDDGARAGCGETFPDVVWVDGVKPFVFARNANIGLRRLGTDAVLLNDDARLITRSGLTDLSLAAQACPEFGAMSAAVKGLVGNPAQAPWSANYIRPELRTLAFICVYIPFPTMEKIGHLDERFVGYGWEDNDYCLRIRHAGMGLAVFDGCVVDHSRPEASTFRTKPEFPQLMEHNLALFRGKWGGDA